MFRRSLPLLLPALALTLSATAQAQGNAMLFDGVNDQCRALDVNGDFDLGNSFTLEAWVRVDTPQPNAGIVATSGDSAGLVGVAGNQAAAVIVRPPSSASFQSAVAPPMTLPTGTWTHHAGTFDGTTIRVYVNGVLEATNTVAMPPQDVDVAPLLFLGVRQAVGQPANFFAGALDEVRVWDYVRSASQIEANYDIELSGQEPGLLAYYQFEEGSGQTIIDSSGGTNNGFLGQTTSVEATDPTRIASGARIRSKVEGALLFDGIDDVAIVADTNNDFDFTTEVTVEAWIRADDASGFNAAMSTNGFGLVADSTNARFFAATPSLNSVTSNGTVPGGEWTHIAGTYDGSFLRVYVNGQLEESSALTGSAGVTGALVIGRFNNTFGHLDGVLDELRLWNVARSSAEIAADFGTELEGDEPGLVGYYKFNEASGQDILDSSTAGNHGVLGSTNAVQSTDPQRIASTLAMNPTDPGGALLFDGIEDIGRASDFNSFFDLGEQCTYEAWARFDSLVGTNIVAGTNGAGLATVGINGEFYTQAPTAVAAMGTVTQGVWTHLAGSYDGSLIRYYINGQLAGTAAQTGTMFNTTVLWFGRLSPTGQFMNGAIDEVRIWNTVRTDAEIAESYLCPPTAPQDGLVGYYKFDEPFGQTLVDSSGLCNEGFLGNSIFTGTDDAVRIASDAPICAGPNNDDCANAIDVSAGGQFLGTTSGATNDGTATCGSSTTAPDVWYSYTATEIGTLDVTTCGTNDLGGVDTGMDSVLTILDGCNGSELACNDDDPGCSPADAQGLVRDSRVMTSLLPGQTVLIRVSYYDFNNNGTPGPFFLNVNFDGGSFVNLCNGDGGDQMGCTDCTCGNNAPAGTIGGCINQTGNSAQLIPGNSASVSASDPADLSFIMTGGNPGTFAILLSGNNLAPQNPANPCFGLGSGLMGGSALDGLRCAVGGVQRHGGRPMDVNGDVGFTTNGWGGSFGPPAGIAAQSGFVPGQTRYFQVFYRALTTEGCGTGQNSSQAVGVTFQP